MKNKQDSSIIFLSIFLSISIIFLCIGYAANGSITGEIKGKVVANKQDGIFITNVVYDSNMYADPSLSDIKSYYQTTLNSSIRLSSNPEQGNSAITYLVTIYNSTDHVYKFNGVKFGDDFYDNENIVYELTNLSVGNKLASKGYVTFYLTFSYLDDTVVDDNELNSYLNFEFVKDDSDIDDGDLEITYTIEKLWNSETTYYYQANFTVTNVGTVAVKKWDLDIEMPADYEYRGGWSTSGLVEFDNSNSPIINASYLRAVDVLEAVTFSIQFGVTDSDFKFADENYIISGTKDEIAGDESGGESGAENEDIPVTTAGLEVTFTLANDPWYDGSLGLQACQWRINLNNTTSEIIKDWQVVVKLTSINKKLGNGWNLQLENNEGYGIITGAGYMNSIASGSSVSDGFIMYIDGVCQEPYVIK